MKPESTIQDVEAAIEACEKALIDADCRALRLWERIRVVPQQWFHGQYEDAVPFWVVGILGHRCLYLNSVEGGWGWGWGRYERWGRIREHHWQQDDIHHVIFQTLVAIDMGGTG